MDWPNQLTTKTNCSYYYWKVWLIFHLVQVNVIWNLSSDCGPFLNSAQPLRCVLEHGKNIQTFIRKGVSMDYSYIMSPLERKHIIWIFFFNNSNILFSRQKSIKHFPLSINIIITLLKVYQGCALAEPGGPWRLNFALGRLKNLRFFIQIICWAP